MTVQALLTTNCLINAAVHPAGLVRGLRAREAMATVRCDPESRWQRKKLLQANSGQQKVEYSLFNLEFKTGDNDTRYSGEKFKNRCVFFWFLHSGGGALP